MYRKKKSHMKSRGNHKCAIRSDQLNLVIYFAGKCFVIHFRTVAVGVNPVLLPHCLFLFSSVIKTNVFLWRRQGQLSRSLCFVSSVIMLNVY